jgi:ribosomal protein S18 acetylase RimI-like enzyme
MKVRLATPSDIQSIAAIHIESWKDSYKNDLPTEFFAGKIDRILSQHWNEIEIQNKNIVLVAEEDSLVGFVAIWCRPIPYIDNLHVKPSHRSKQIGSILMKTAARELIDKGHKKAYLWVFESNEKAKRFYKRLGGIQKELEQKAIFGYKVLNRKIVWDDLSILARINIQNLTCNRV